MNAIEPDRDRDVVLVREGEKFGKTFFERPAHALRIPNEMSDAKRSEIFSGIPSGEAGDASIALVLPDTFPNAKRVRLGNLNGRGRVCEIGRQKSRQTGRENAAAAAMMMAG